MEMRFLLLSAIILSVSGLLVFSVFYNNIKFATRNVVPEKAAGIPPKKSGGADAFAPAKQKSVPPGFKGPDVKPHIIGPSGPPPNY